MSTTPDPWPPPGQHPPPAPPPPFAPGLADPRVGADEAPTLPGIQLPPLPLPPPFLPGLVDTRVSIGDAPTLPGIQLPAQPGNSSSRKRTTGIVLGGVAVVLLICLVGGVFGTARILGAAFGTSDTGETAEGVNWASPSSSLPATAEPAVPAPTSVPAAPSSGVSENAKPPPAAPSLTTFSPTTSLPATSPPTRPSPTRTINTPPPVPTTAAPPVLTTDPRYRTCAEAKRHGYGPYYRGQDPEYDWYKDANKDGVVCE